MQSVINICRAVMSVMLMALAVALFNPATASAQAPQSKFAEVNGVRLHYLVAGKGDPACCCTATPKPAICGCR